MKNGHYEVNEYYNNSDSAAKTTRTHVGFVVLLFTNRRFDTRLLLCVERGYEV